MKSNVKEWKEPWKKKEFGARLSKRALKDQQLGDKQRNRMKKAATQDIKIEFHRALLGTPGLFKVFTLKMKIPLRMEEIEEKMKLAFPEVTGRES